MDSGFTANAAGHTGGAVSNSGGTGSVSGCSFTGNSAGGGGGGGISVFGGALTIVNDTFTDNTTTGSGGGVEVVFGTATVTGCTFTNNTAVQGGGIANLFGTLSVGTSAFSGNTPDDIFGVYTDLGGNTVTLGCRPEAAGPRREGLSQDLTPHAGRRQSPRGRACRDGAAGPAVPGPDQRRREIAGELVRGARRGAGRRAGVAAGAGRTDPRRGGVGRERECAARSVRDGVREVVHHQRFFNTRGATEP